MDTPKSPIRTTVTEEVLVLLARNGRMTAKAFAAEIGWKYSYLNRRLHGETPWSVDDLEDIATYFDIPVTDLFGGSNTTGNVSWNAVLDPADLATVSG